MLFSQALKIKIEGAFLTGFIVVMIICYTNSVTAIGLPIIGHLCDTIIVASLVKEL